MREEERNPFGSNRKLGPSLEEIALQITMCLLNFIKVVEQNIPYPLHPIPGVCCVSKICTVILETSPRTESKTYGSTSIFGRLIRIQNDKFV